VRALGTYVEEVDCWDDGGVDSCKDNESTVGDIVECNGSDDSVNESG